MTTNSLRKRILELCSESEYGSWEFWSNKKHKSKEECTRIIETLSKLVDEKRIVSIEYSSVKDQSYKEVPLDVAQLKRELECSMNDNVDSSAFYWFLTTEEGRKEDFYCRSSGGH